jgi:c-di-GMP-binding flagellar brake protein YcgR
MTERRREPRRKEGNRVTIEPVPKAPDASTKKISFSLTDDISLKGIKVISDTFFPADTLLKIELSLAELENPLDLQGTVKWIRCHEKDLYEIGIEFVGLTPDIARLLVNHMYRFEDEF